MKNRNKIGNYSEKGYAAYVTQQIIKIINNKQYTKAAKFIQEELNKMPNDKHLISLLIHCYLMLGEYKDMLSFIEEDLDLKTKNKIAYAAIKLDDVESLKYLYYEYYKSYQDVPEDDISSYNVIRYYLMKKFEPTKRINIDKISYRQQQIWAYDEKLALEKTREISYSPTNESKTMFYPTVDMEKLFEQAKESIESNKDNFINEFLGDTYIFHCPGCGINKETKEECDYLLVTTVFNSSNIVYMKPTSTITPQTKISTFINKNAKTTTPHKGRKPTRIEIFNNRYKKED